MLKALVLRIRFVHVELDSITGMSDNSFNFPCYLSVYKEEKNERGV